MSTTETTTATETTTSTGTPEPSRTRALSAPVVAALEATWSSIQARHSEVPDVVIVVASGTVGVPRGSLRLGHFAAMRWHHTGAQGRLPEVFVGGEGLARGAVDVLGTLLHEATHALAHVRGIQETSRQGRYHNARFRDLAAELGLRVERVPVIGWSDTHVPDQTTAHYAGHLADLAEALVIHRYAEGAATAGGTGAADGDDDQDEDGEPAPAAPSNACRCACPRRITVAPTIHALGPITCSICGEPFTRIERR